ncbi:uncharacterized protein LOC129971925 [Argiope bruennichi]|uniref:uncharacterized protein LOC129971925 n=1 Tax=Argiope bruennichi TaxID=94029 RepID=UPI002493FF01|nr:uncharacterized protein LOC129971925 [Argiope bruennichi]
MEKDITSLNRTRGGIKAQITRLLTSIKDQQFEDVEIEEIEVKLDKVRKLNQQFELLRQDYYKVVKRDEDLVEIENSFEDIDSDLLKLESPKSKFISQSFKPRTLVTKVNDTSSRCAVCRLPANHPIYKCKGFLDLNAVERFNMVKKLSLCVLCLKPGHKLAFCRQSKYLCNICNGNHNYLLHRHSKPSSEGENATHSEAIPSEPRTDFSPKDVTLADSLRTSSACLLIKNKSVLLPTAIVLIQNIYGHFSRARVILDSASQANFVTKQFADSANLRKQKINTSVSGLGGISTSIEYEAVANIANCNGSFCLSQTFFVIDKITDMVPATNVNLENLEIPQVMLGDPEFTRSSKIDALLGAETFFEIVKGEQIRSSLNSLIFQNTVFGYVVGGYVNTNNQEPCTNLCTLVSRNENIEKVIEKFWLVENISEENTILSSEEEFCEAHFKETHTRNKDGRFVVKMPMKEGLLGDSKALANVRLNQTVKRLHKNPMMQNLYKEFIAEYESLGHMEKVNNDMCEGSYYLPDHGVYKPENSTTKLRVVFNASAPSTSGQSLNDLLLAGAVKENIFEIMTRFRTYKYAFTADIKKMYRQILIDESQRNLLKILWKDNMNQSPTTYRLNTVTYGTKSAPFLAIRCLKQLALDEAKKFPLASQVTLTEVYMDDFVSGAATLEAAQELQRQLIQMLQTCGMELHKWTSNSSELINNSSEETNQQYFLVDRHSSVKALGLNWQPKEDYFLFKVDLKIKPFYTKRDVLSVIARLHDPLGLVGPVITKAKIFMQKLWIQQLNWEDTLPQSIQPEWSNFVTSLKVIENLKVPRHILTESYERTVIVGYADASEAAFGAVVYMKSIMEDGTAVNKLIASKSRVAPIKVISIPRLELSACLLLSQLIERIRPSLQMLISEAICYTDSKIALAWIKTPPYKLKTFVATRVSKIQTLTENFQWKHISSQLNPADVISRGLNLHELLTNDLWWCGPDYLPDSKNYSSVELDESAISDEQYLTELKSQSNISLSSPAVFQEWFHTYMCLAPYEME